MWLERERERKEKRREIDEDPRMFFKQSELFQGKAHLKALGMNVSVL